ncbi:MAG: hypothetical protein CME63_15730 [Halobacteriovoraceae bacterium]|jgi:hypothetical protein|nr:hypothetical protein [Halobacteriovoraceae bacterium]MBC99192.1 hypothetical protein [Halobacteriovoraceae bacterium]|tara:strand:- start:175490 stop:175963 length:474 start_codon:yes stop_codon:yes gene_type:complete
MSDTSDKKNPQPQSSQAKKPYQFGGIKDFNLEEIENEVLNDSVYLDVFAGSDIRFKENIEPLKGGLEELKNIQAYEYHYKTDEFPEHNFPKEKTVGVMAQQLENILPLAVKEDDKGMKYVNYASLAPLLIEAVKELSAKVDQQAEEINSLKIELKNK